MKVFSSTNHQSHKKIMEREVNNHVFLVCNQIFGSRDQNHVTNFSSDVFHQDYGKLCVNLWALIFSISPMLCILFLVLSFLFLLSSVRSRRTRHIRQARLNSPYSSSSDITIDSDGENEVVHNEIIDLQLSPPVSVNRTLPW